MIITPNTLGHYPKGYPRSVGGYSGDVREELEQATDTPDLTAMKAAIDEAQGDASSYFGRNACARDWWYARWAGQTVDGRKWGTSGIDPWPWPGASDTRVRTVEKVIGQHRTLATYALRNMKVQAKSTRPAVSMKQSQQATTLLNWMVFSHMGADLHRELRLAVSWRNGYGAAVLHNGWDQQRLLNYIDVNVAGLQDFVNEPSVQAFLMGSGGGGGSNGVMEYGSNGGSGSGNSTLNSQLSTAASPAAAMGMGNLPLGETLTITDLQEMIMDPAYTDDLAVLLRTISHEFLSVREARTKLEQLRELRTVEVPVPYVFRSQPEITALRPMVDVIYPVNTDNFQRAPWVARVENVSAAILRDRVETAGYSQKFVDDALDRRGPSSGTNLTWRGNTDWERGRAGAGVGAGAGDDIELYHFYSLVHDRGVPVRFCTVFHMDVDEPAKHEVDGYEHGESCFHPMRFETNERPINSSQGIAEKAYTWEHEIKKQRDARTDRADLALRPPLLTTYEALSKMKAQFEPGIILPTRKFDESQWFKPPMWDPGSIEIEKTVELGVETFFAIFGQNVDPQLAAMRREEQVDDLLAELKPVTQQMLKNMRQLLPDADVAAVVGSLSRPFHVSRAELQGEWEVTATVDLRDIDSDWAKERFALVPQIFATDTQGQINRTPIIKTMLGWLGYDLAESALPDDTEQVTQKEIQDEETQIDLIIGSGRDRPLPQGANYQLRLQTLQNAMQQFTQNPVVMAKLQATPDIMKVLMNRAQYFERQLQQQQNAQIGRMQVGTTFGNQGPTVAEPSALMAPMGG